MPSGRKRVAPKRTRQHLEIQITRLTKRVRKLKKELAAEKAKWVAECPQGHLIRHDKCTVMCHITMLDPSDSPFIAYKPTLDTNVQPIQEWLDGVLDCMPERRRTIIEGSIYTPAHPLPEDHQSALADLAEMYYGMDAQFRIEPTRWYERIPTSWGWWWRVPYGWWLKLVDWSYSLVGLTAHKKEGNDE